MATTSEMRQQLEACGFVVGERDPRLNTNYTGEYMVAEAYDESDELPTQDGRNGPWCIVGDDLDALIAEAYENATPFEADSTPNHGPTEAQVTRNMLEKYGM